MVCPASQSWSRSARGTRVVLPAPGGASSTASWRAARASRKAGSTASIGKEIMAAPEQAADYTTVCGSELTHECGVSVTDHVSDLTLSRASSAPTGDFGLKQIRVADAKSEHRTTVGARLARECGVSVTDHISDMTLSRA